MILRYDGSLAGFFCLAGTAIKERLAVTGVFRSGEPVNGDLFASERRIATDRDWAAKVTDGLETRLGKGFLTCVAQALLSEEEGIEVDLLQLLRRGLREGAQLLDRRDDPLVYRVDSAALRTVRERHRWLGLLRFEELTDGSFLARCEPRSNVVPLLGSHFSRRLGDARWLILDVKRKLGVWGEHRRWELVEGVELPDSLAAHPREEEIASLWRGFYQSVSNPDRHNPKLRQQFMPKRYWGYLTELGAK